MKVVTKYIADDGREFSSEEKCKRYEEDLLEREKILEAMETLSKFCLKHAECSDCPLAHDDDCSLCSHGTIPADWSERDYKNVSDDETEEDY